MPPEPLSRILGSRQLCFQPALTQSNTPPILLASLITQRGLCGPRSSVWLGQDLPCLKSDRGIVEFESQALDGRKVSTSV